MSKDESNLEERLFKLMEEYKQPFSEAENKPDNGLVSGFVGGLLALVTAGVLAVGSFFAYQHFRPAQTAYLPSPTPVVEEFAEASLMGGKVSLDIAPTYTSQPSPFPTPTSVPPTPTPVPPTPIFNPTPLPASQVVMEGPFRQHQLASIGSGPLMNVTFSDGMAAFDEGWLATYHYRLQRIRPEENPDGCGVSVYNTNKIWYGSEPNTITVNGVPIAENYVQTGSHGYIFEYPLNIGDRICITHVPQSGYHIYFGPDLYWHYDSYCYRGHC